MYCAGHTYCYININKWQYIHFTKDRHFTSLHFTSLHSTLLCFTPHFSLPWTFGRSITTLQQPYTSLHIYFPNPLSSGFGVLEVACWPLVPKFAGSNPDEAVRFYRAKKILSTPSFGGEVKPSVPCRSFTACKRFLNATWKSGISGKNSSAISRPHSSTFGY